jgi:hypothetical protein
MHAPKDSIELPTSRKEATAALKTIFGVDFHLSGDDAPAASSVAVPLSADGSISRALAMHTLKSALSRLRAHATNGSQGPLELLAASFVRAHAAEASDAVFVSFWKDMCALASPDHVTPALVAHFSSILELYSFSWLWNCFPSLLPSLATVPGRTLVVVQYWRWNDFGSL